MVMLYSGLIVDNNNVGYNSIATIKNKSAIDIDENRNANPNLRFVASLGTLKMLKNATIGTTKKIGLVLNN